MQKILPAFNEFMRTEIADVHFFVRLLQSEDAWCETRRFLYPSDNDSWESYNQEAYSTAHLHAEKLMVPIHIPEKDHFLAIIRFKTPEGSDKYWDFAFIDSLNNDEYFSLVKGVIENRTTLANDGQHLSDENQESDKGHFVSSNWATIKCVKQKEFECGCRMILHMYIANFCSTLAEFEAKIQELNNIKNLAEKVRNWVADLYEDTKNLNYQPDWLRDYLFNEKLDPMNANARLWSAQGPEAIPLGISPMEVGATEGISLHHRRDSRATQMDNLGRDLQQLTEEDLDRFQDRSYMKDVKKAWASEANYFGAPRDQDSGVKSAEC